jgi:hypothetical protein
MEPKISQKQVRVNYPDPVDSSPLPDILLIYDPF